MVIILRYYLFALMLFPCGDEQVGAELDAIDTVLLSQDEGHQDHSEHDDCSPLCVCHCCHLHYVVHDHNEIQFLKPYSIFSKVYLSDIPEDQVKDFLKPPKFYFA